MPTYEYKCKACGHEMELFQSMSAAPKRKCPKCGKSQLERLIGTGAALIFKGSGFYQTDYRTENYKKGKEADTKPAGGDAKADGKTDSKPEAKSDSKSETKTEKKPETKPEPKPKSKGKSKSSSD